jgi:hypothetical protein
MWQAILAAALKLPTYYGDTETPGERLQRLTIVAESIDYASARATCTGEPEGCRRVWPGSRKELAALLLVQAWQETRLAQHVHADQCAENECDRGRAKSLWQLQPNSIVTRPEWQTLGGTDQESTRAAAWAAARMLATNRFRCAKAPGDWVTPTISGYARGNECEWSGAKPRVEMFWRIFTTL